MRAPSKIEHALFDKVAFLLCAAVFRGAEGGLAA